MTDAEKEELEAQYTAAKVRDIDTLKAALSDFENEIDGILADCPDRDMKERLKGQAMYKGQTVYLEAIGRIANERPDWDKEEERALEKLAQDPEYIKTQEEIKQLQIIARIFEKNE